MATKMWKVVKTFEKKNRPWRAEVRTWEDRPLRYVVVTNGQDIDYPIKYSDGRIAYDRPEQLPQYVRPLVIKAYEWLGLVDLFCFSV